LLRSMLRLRERSCERFVLRQENEMRVDSRKFLSVGGLVLISTLAVNGATARENAAVKDVSFNTIGDSLEVKITTTQEAKFTYFELNAPHRLVVDFHGIQNDIGFREKQIATAGVRRVRTALFESKDRKATRIVFDLSDNALYRVLDDGAGTVRVVFGQTAHAPLNLTAGPPVVPEPSETSLAARPTVKLDPALFGGQIAEPVPPAIARAALVARSEEHTSELQSRFDLVCRLLLEKKNESISTPARWPYRRSRTRNSPLFACSRRLVPNSSTIMATRPASAS